MKKLFRLKTSLSILFLFFTILLFGQKRYSLSLQFKHGFTDVENLIDRIEDNEENGLKPVGSEISIGVDNDFSLSKGKFVSVSGGILWNYYSFTKQGFSQGINLSGTPPSEFFSTSRYKSSSIISPLSLNVRLKKIGFSWGVISRYHLKTKVINEQTFGTGGFHSILVSNSETFQNGDFYQINSPRSHSVFLESKMDCFYLLGMNLFLNEKLSFEFEFKNLINPNLLVSKTIYEAPLYATATLTRKFDFNAKTISVGLNWKIF